MDEISQMFGGMDMVAVEGIHGKDGKEYIIEVQSTIMCADRIYIACQHLEICPKIENQSTIDPRYVKKF